MARLKNDQYFTPPAIAYPLLDVIDISNQWVFEPCAGDKAIAKVLEIIAIAIDGVQTADIDNELTGLDDNDFDATAIGHWNEKFMCGHPDWVITNPPYKQPDCDQIIQNAWEFAEEGIAMLLRLSYLEPCQNRAKFLKEANLSNLIIFNPRPQFIPGKKATDSSTVAWFVWRKNWLSLGTCITYCTDWND
jgi:hypothetical protein